MLDFNWVSLDVAHSIHAMQLGEHGGTDGVRDQRRLESALAAGEMNEAQLADWYREQIVAG
jgi:prophage maintenance system killer protein